MDRPDLELIDAAFPGDPVLDVALTHALLRDVAAGRRGATLRIFRPGPTVAFGKLDRLLDGLPAACRCARALGRTPLIRLAGGQAAVYDERCVVVEHVSAEADVTAGLRERFAAQSARIAGALRALGVDARVGPLAGEYCPGEHSINVGGRRKVAGIAQRAVRGAAVTSAVVVVGGGEDLRAAVAAVYAALGRDVDAAVAGALDEAAPGLDADDISASLRAAYAADLPLRETAAGEALLKAARALAPEHAAP